MADIVKNKRIQKLYGRFLQDKQGKLETKKTFRNQLEKVQVEKRPIQKRSAHRNINHRPIILGKSKRITLGQAINISKYAPIISEMSQKHNVPAELICGVILQESNGKARAKSHAGARGLMQLMPATAKRFGVKDIYNPRQNIEGGTKYLRFLLNHFKGDVKLSLAGYNAGEHNVKKYGNKIPPFKETQKYVPAVIGYTKTMAKILVSSKTIPTFARRI